MRKAVEESCPSSYPIDTSGDELISVVWKCPPGLMVSHSLNSPMNIFMQHRNGVFSLSGCNVFITVPFSDLSQNERFEHYINPVPAG